ncbi:MAG: extracellular solute-binding protein [Acetobacteraceae bacterium]
MIGRRVLLGGLGGALALGAVVPAFAQGDAVDIAAARKEGNVVWYTSTPIKGAQAVAVAFQKKYRMKLQLYRSGGTATLSRFMQERAGKQVGADVMTVSNPVALMKLAEEGAFVAFNPEGYEHIPESLRSAHGYYVPQRLNIITIYGRTDLVPAGQLPASWTDLANPKYKGKLVMPDPSYSAITLVTVASIAKLYGWEYYKKLRAQNMMVVNGTDQVFDMVKRGERPIACGGDESNCLTAIKDGQPFRNIIPADGAAVVPGLSAVIKGGPHPAAAKLLAQFLISKEGQDIIADYGDYPARDDIAPPVGAVPLKKLTMLPLDYPYVASSTPQIEREFNEIFL